MYDVIRIIGGRVAKLLPVGFTARIALFGVIALGLAGAAHGNRQAIDTVRVKAQVESLDSKIDALREGQVEQKTDLTNRLDRIEDKVDMLLAERRAEPASRSRR